MTLLSLRQAASLTFELTTSPTRCVGAQAQVSMNAGWAVREDWAAANLASFSNGFEKLKTVGDKLQEHSKKVSSP